MSYRIIFTLFIIIALIGISCEDRTINPFEEENGVYSIYSAMSVNESTNYVRVRKLDTPLLADSSIGVDAVVTFTDLSTGQQTELRDTVVNFSGNYTQNFIVDEELVLDNQYEINVEGLDGRSSRSIATTPLETELFFTPTVDTIFCETRLKFIFNNVRKPEFVDMEIGVEYKGKIHWAIMEIVGKLEHAEGSNEMFVFMSPRNLLVEVFTPPLPDNPFFDFYRLMPTVRCHELDSNTFRIRYRHFGPEWGTVRPWFNSSGPLDIEAGDIERGIGFFGAYNSGEISFDIGFEQDN